MKDRSIIIDSDVFFPRLPSNELGIVLLEPTVVSVSAAHHLRESRDVAFKGPRPACRDGVEGKPPKSRSRQAQHLGTSSQSPKWRSLTIQLRMEQHA